MSRITRNTNSSIDEPEVSLSNKQNERDNSNLNRNENNMSQQQNVSHKRVTNMANLLFKILIYSFAIIFCIFINEYTFGIFCFVLGLHFPVCALCFFTCVWCFCNSKRTSTFLRIVSTISLLIFVVGLFTIKESGKRLDYLDQYFNVTSIVQDFMNKNHN